MTSATSSGFNRFANPTAAAWAVDSLSSMLLLVSSSSARAIGCCRREKKLIDCCTPSSKTSNSCCSRSVTYLLPSITDTLSDTSSTPERSLGCCWAEDAVTAAATHTKTSEARRIVMFGGLPGSRSRGEPRTCRPHLDLVRRDQHVGTAIGDDVLIQEFIGELVQRLGDCHRRQQLFATSTGLGRPLGQHQVALAHLVRQI